DHRAAVRPDGLRHPRRAGGEGRRAHAWYRVADGRPADQAGLVGGALDGETARDQRGDGRAVATRCTRHPRHRHPRLPTVITPRNRSAGAPRFRGHGQRWATSGRAMPDSGSPDIVFARPIKTARIANVAAVIVFGVFVIVAIVMPHANAGATFG